MANTRMISSLIWEDDFFTSLSMFERLVWVGIITACADDQGRFQDNANLIVAKVFPLDDINKADIETALNRFVKAGKLHRYTAKGKKLAQITNWWKHQKPRWAAASNYPAPDNWTDRERYHTTGNEIKELNWKTGGGFIDGYIAGNTTNDVNGDVKDDVNGDGDDEDENAQKPPVSSVPSGGYITRVISKVTGLVSITDDTAKVIPAIEGLYHQFNQDENALIEYLKPFYQAWIVRRGQDGRKYQRTNFTWLYKWAVGGEIPEPGNNGHGSTTKSKQDRSLENLQAAYEEAIREENNGDQS